MFVTTWNKFLYSEFFTVLSLQTLRTTPVSLSCNSLISGATDASEATDSHGKQRGMDANNKVKANFFLFFTPL